MSLTAYLGLGSNMDFEGRDPQQVVAAAMRDLAAAGAVSGRSSFYLTEPVGVAEQACFVNAAVELRTDLAPEELLAELLRMERRYGRDRTRGVAKGPRTLDLDLLLVAAESGEGLIYESESLTLPHPEMARRRFVLAPLAEIAPQLEHPVLRKTVAELLAALPEAGPNAAGAVRVLGRAEKAR